MQRDSLRFVSYNIHSCRSARLEPSLDDVVHVIGDAQPDVVALQEVDVDCPRTDQIHQAEEIGRRLEMTPHFFSLVDWSQFQSPHECQGRYGLAFLARKDLHLLDSRQIYLPLLSPLSEPRGVFQLQVEWQGKPFSILNTHLSVHRRENLLQMEALSELVQQVWGSGPHGGFQYHWADAGHQKAAQGDVGMCSNRLTARHFPQPFSLATIRSYFHGRRS